MEAAGDWGGDEGKHGRIVHSESKEKRMKRWSNLLRLASILLAVPLLVSCAPGVVETPNPEEIDDRVATSVAMTVEAQGQIATSVALTVAAQQAAAIVPTGTPFPSPLPTLTPVLATATPFATSTSSGGSGSGGGGGGTTTYQFSCDIIRQRPIDNTEFKRTNTFDVTFAILNNGTATWEAGKDLVLLGNPGPTLINPPGTIQLPKMEPGDVFTVGPFDAEAPDDPGRYVIDFKLEGGFCYPYVAFYVVR
jgi:hypothetical protein